MRVTLDIVLIKLINIVTSVAVFALALRFIFRLLGANPESGIVEVIYTSTAPLLNPFRTVFEPYVIEPGNIIEFSTLVTIVFYLTIAWFLVEIIKYVTNHNTIVLK